MLFVEFTQCPYDSSAIESATHASGSTLLTCPTCGAAWEWYRTWLRRISEPDRQAVLNARAGRQAPPVARGAPDLATVASMWRRIRQ